MRPITLFGIVVALIRTGQPVVSRFAGRVAPAAADRTGLRYAMNGLSMLPFILRRGIFHSPGLERWRAIVSTRAAGSLRSLVPNGGPSRAPV